MLCKELQELPFYSVAAISHTCWERNDVGTNLKRHSGTSCVIKQPLAGLHVLSMVITKEQSYRFVSPLVSDLHLCDLAYFHFFLIYCPQLYITLQQLVTFSQKFSQGGKMLQHQGTHAVASAKKKITARETWEMLHQMTQFLL